MQSFLRSLIAVPAVALVAACSGPSEREAPLSADLQQDLELAKSKSLELASARRGQVAVSALEAAPAGQTRQGERVARPTPRRQSPPALVQVARRSTQVAEAPIAEPEATEEAATGEEAAFVEAPAGDLAEAPAPAETPEVISGPQVTPEGIGSGRPRDPGGWGDLGRGSGRGSVVRGGSVGDDDHCQYHPRGGMGGVISIGRRMPPVYNPRSYPMPVVGEVLGGGRQRSGGGSVLRSRGVVPSIVGAAAAVGGGDVSAGRSRRRN